MKPILIHNDNTYLLKSFQDNEWYIEKFLPSLQSDIDIQLDSFIKNKIASKEISALFIKVTLSSNYLELLGLRLGLHIRLSYKHSHLQKLPIVFLCEESFEELSKIYNYPEILFRQGVYVTSEEFSNVQLYFELISKGKLLGCDSIDALINRLNILPPANYLSHHSIANEWSILRWAKVLAMPEDYSLLQEVKNNIEGLLYYKFLQSKFPIESEPNKASFKIQGKGKILYIDDEWDKGWNVVFNTFISISPNLEQDFEVFEYDFKDKTEDLIIKDCENKIKDSDPAIVILDLRLADSDFETNKKTSNLTGFKILKIIKEMNPGIRVIIFTASNKVWNLIELQNEGADGFVLKESPELGINKNYTKTSVEKFALLIQEQLKYQFQKEFFIKCKEIKRNLLQTKNEENEDYNKLINTLVKQIDIIYSSISLINLKKQVTLDIVFLTCYNFLELFKNYYLIYKKDYRYYLGFEDIDLIRYNVSGGTVVSNGPFIANGRLDSPSWFVIQAALFIDYFKVSVSPDFSEVVNLRRISDKRNDYIHSTKKSFDPAEVKLIIEALSNACKQIKE
jgi:DNA-binding NarL/FixJ family response regulator